MNIWIVLVIASVILLIIYRGSRNAVWGGFNLGIIIGIIIAVFYLFKGNDFDWIIIGKGMISGIIIR